MTNAYTPPAADELANLAAGFRAAMQPSYEDGVIDPALVNLANLLFINGRGGYDTPSEALFGIAVSAVRLYVSALAVEGDSPRSLVDDISCALQAIGENLEVA